MLASWLGFANSLMADGVVVATEASVKQLEGVAKKLGEREVFAATSSQALSAERSCSRRSKSTAAAAPSDGVRAKEMLGWGSPSSMQHRGGVHCLD
uniref:Uncharacterized protein n=1 Tax=Oryza glumipatula TaxID=40148 RepID=A0A0E0B653_9ORYZ